jgi:hypothetical protein
MKSMELVFAQIKRDGTDHLECEKPMSAILQNMSKNGAMKEKTP